MIVFEAAACCMTSLDKNANVPTCQASKIDTGPCTSEGTRDFSSPSPVGAWLHFFLGPMSLFCQEEDKEEPNMKRQQPMQPTVCQPLMKDFPWNSQPNCRQKLP